MAKVENPPKNRRGKDLSRIQREQKQNEFLLSTDIPRSSFPYQLYDVWCLCIFAFIGHPSVCLRVYIYEKAAPPPPPPVTVVEFIYKYYPPEADKVKPFSTENCKILFTCPRFSSINYVQISIPYLYASLSKYRMNNF